MILVNVGCGEVHHDAWTNLDMAPSCPSVRRYDARKPLPFETGSVAAIYHAHLLEHLPTKVAHGFLVECRRVLRPGGIIRVVLPDLEGIVRAYLHGLADVRQGGDPTLWQWARLELTDQIGREVSGGEMASFAKQLAHDQLASVRERAGDELDGMRRMGRTQSRQITLGKIARRAHRELARAILYLVGGGTMRRRFDVGCFRESGEIHRVMYDAVSLERALAAAGFVQTRSCSATESRIPEFASYALDVVDGRVRKPDSLFMEAVRP